MDLLATYVILSAKVDSFSLLEWLYIVLRKYLSVGKASTAHSKAPFLSSYSSSQYSGVITANPCPLLAAKQILLVRTSSVPEDGGFIGTSVIRGGFLPHELLMVGFILFYYILFYF